MTKHANYLTEAANYLEIVGPNFLKIWRSGRTFGGSGPARASSGRLLGRHMARERGRCELFSPLGRHYRDFESQTGGPELPKIKINCLQNRDPFLDPLRSRPGRVMSRFLLENGAHSGGQNWSRGGPGAVFDAKTLKTLKLLFL